MIINYFDKYLINTDDLKEKLDLIATSDTENASFLTHTFNKTINYLFKEQIPNYDNVRNGLPSSLEEYDGIVYFDNCDDTKPNIFDNVTNLKIIIVGNHFRRVEDNIYYFNISDIKKILHEVKDMKKICFGANIDAICSMNYYYGRMRTYFLNLTKKLNEINIDELKIDIEKCCSDLLLDITNFEIYKDYNGSEIRLKSIFKIYKKIIEHASCFPFYTSYGLNDEKCMILNIFAELIRVYDLPSREDIKSYVYDEICKQMLDEAIKLGYCFFIDNKCVSSRCTDGFPHSKENGCCSNTDLDRGKNCRYLNEDHSCSVCAISCRVFTCKYLQDRGFDHSLWQYPLIDCVIGKFSKTRIIFGFFTPKEKMMKRIR